MTADARYRDRVTASRRRTVIVTVAALGVAFLLVWAATAGPAGRRREQQPTQSPASLGAAGCRPRSRAAGPRTRRATTPPAGRPDAAARGLQDLRRLRARCSSACSSPRRLLRLLAAPADAPARRRAARARRSSPLPDVEAAREALRRDRERQHAALAGSDVRNGIVACWVLLEEAAAEAGVATAAGRDRPPSSWCASCTPRRRSPPGRRARRALPRGPVLHATRCLPTPGTRAEQALAGIHRDLARTRGDVRLHVRESGSAGRHRARWPRRA